MRCWFAPEDMKIGAKIRDVIEEAIRLRDKVLLVLSEASIASTWVEGEVEKAFEEERQRGGLVLFPVRLDDVVLTTPKAWAGYLRRTRHIGDFHAWKDHDDYQRTLERLLRDLRDLACPFRRIDRRRHLAIPPAAPISMQRRRGSVQRRALPCPTIQCAAT